MRLTDFKILTFDCYGTLIDWEAGLLAALAPLIARAGVTQETALEDFSELESAQEAATPDFLYPAILAAVHGGLGRRWGVHASAEDGQKFGRSVRDWPAFADSAAALAYLKQHYRLAILSNVDRESFSGSNARLGATFDAVHTAEDIGSYKPDPRNFRYLLDRCGEMGCGRADILHVAQSLYHDHGPANEAGISSVWIDRRAGKSGGGATRTPARTPRYDWRFDSLAALVTAHQAERARNAAA